MTYGNRSTGYGYSPDRSKDVDRFNPSTRANYSTNYNTNGYGCYTPTHSTPKRSGWYDDYTNEDGTLCKRVWMDGEEEIWKIAK